MATLKITKDRLIANLKNKGMSNEEISNKFESITEASLKQAKQTVKAKFEAVEALLKEVYPKAFTEEKPLKVGIINDLAENQELTKQASKTCLRKYLMYYTSSPKYLKSFEKASFRIDLFGNNCEELTAEHKEFAAKTLREIFAKTKKKKPNS